MITIKNTQKTYPVKKTVLQKIVRRMHASLGLSGFDVSIWITTDPTIKKFNNQFRNKDKATDILSFPFHNKPINEKNIELIREDERNLGDIIISAQYAARQAKGLWQRSFDEHMIALLAHGIAHLIGHDHLTDKEYKQMQLIEKKLIAAVTKNKR